MCLNRSRGFIPFRFHRVQNGLTKPEISKFQRKLQTGRRKQRNTTKNGNCETDRSWQSENSISESNADAFHHDNRHTLRARLPVKTHCAMERHPSRDRTSCLESGMRPRDEEPASQGCSARAHGRRTNRKCPSSNATLAGFRTRCVGRKQRPH